MVVLVNFVLFYIKLYSYTSCFLYNDIQNDVQLKMNSKSVSKQKQKNVSGLKISSTQLT